jgi:hypothetical protein
MAQPLSPAVSYTNVVSIAYFVINTEGGTMDSVLNLDVLPSSSNLKIFRSRARKPDGF